VASTKRLHALPDMPTIAETVPGFEMMAWQGLFVPAKTPLPVVDKLQKAVAQALADPAVKKRLESTWATRSWPARIRPPAPPRASR
jgi:tripartite-type tricarboxylate transporter receptor subunit TctC